MPTQPRSKLKSQVEVDPSANGCFTASVDSLPDLTTLSDDALKQLIEELEQEEDRISYERRVMHGRLDILRAERTARLKQKGGHLDVAGLSEILAGKVAPPDTEAK